MTEFRSRFEGAAEFVERNVLYALEPPQRVPLGLAVANVVDDRHIPTPSLPAIAARRTAAFPLAYAQQSIFKSLLYDGCADQVRA